jgi:glycosyltransferase involved in cell wall biosynthesis
MAHYSGYPEHDHYLQAAIEGILAQTETNWHLVVIDDASPRPESRELLTHLATRCSGRMTVLMSKENDGPGASRNRGIAFAAENGAPFVLFHDSDDLACRNRLELTARAFAEPGVDFVYSNFRVIDEESQSVPYAEITPSLREIIDVLNTDPPSGSSVDVLEKVGTQTGYATLTSTVAVRTSLAMAHPFPKERVSEDLFAWYQYFAAGERVMYMPEILAAYRILRAYPGSLTRRRLGESFYTEKARVDSMGFLQALDMAISRKVFDPARRAKVLQCFYKRLAVTMYAEGYNSLAGDLENLAANVAI